MSLAPSLPNSLPPQNVEAETFVLGCVLKSRRAAEQARDLLRPEDFYLNAHRSVFANALALLENDTPPDPGLLAEALRKQGRLEDYGGLAWLDSLPAGVHAVSLMEHYAEIVREKANLRKLIEAGTTVIAEAYDEELGSEEIRGRAEARLGAIAGGKAAPAPLTGVELASAVYDAIFGKGEERPILSGWGNLDRITGGLPQDLIIVAGRPSMGKSAWAVALGANLAERGEPNLVLSLETPTGITAKRLVAARSGVRLDRLRSGVSHSPEELRAINRANDWLAGLPLHIHDEAGMTVPQIRELVRRMKAAHGLRACIIDQLPLIARSERTENENIALSRIVTALQLLARTEGLPVILLHQLSRGVERREIKRPLMSDLRESGAIEERAGLVLLLYRESYYRARESGEPEQEETLLEVGIGKQREGSTGTLRYFYNLATQDIAELEAVRDERDAPPESRVPYAE